VSPSGSQNAGGWTPTATEVKAEHSPAWTTLGVVHAFAVRQPGVIVDVEKAEAVTRLAPLHKGLRRELGLELREILFAEQVHGADVAAVDGSDTLCQPGVDALVTSSTAVCLGIYTADCCAVFLTDPLRRVAALAHSGAKGTRLGVVQNTVRCMVERFGCQPADIHALLSPCIRPPLYEWDFAAEIRGQLANLGVQSVMDSGLCTGADTLRYYSYRMEKGRTGRMLALLALT
jgi:copper oxidase (laccase) domain-containing protein